MSSLAAARADNFYFDPNKFDPSKRGRDGYNAIANSHPLGERAKRLKSEGILVVRFELPHDGWCAGCGQHVARGVRFNADKKRDGSYLSTPIYTFTMKCTACPSIYVIRTDPEHSEYQYVSGIARQEKHFDAEEDPSLAARAQPSKASREARATNALYRLEAETDDARRAKSDYGRLATIAEMQAARYGDDYSSNAELRAVARARRGVHAAAVAAGAARGLRIPLQPPAVEDEAAVSDFVAAQHVRRGDSGAVARGAGMSASVLPAAARASLIGESIFGAPVAASTAATQRRRLSTSMTNARPRLNAGASGDSGNHTRPTVQTSRRDTGTRLLTRGNAPARPREGSHATQLLALPAAAPSS